MTEIIPVNYGRTSLPENMIFYGGDESKIQPIILRVYLIKTEDKLILVDAGCVTMPGFDVKDFIGPVEALKKINISPLQITHVIITHAHHDHIQCVSEFKNAKVYIQKDEYENGKSYFNGKTEVVLFKDELCVTENVKVINSGGHSVGSSVVEITADGKTSVIVGDECYKRECLEKQIPTGAYYSREKSIGFIKKYGKGDFNVLLCHDE